MLAPAWNEPSASNDPIAKMSGQRAVRREDFLLTGPAGRSAQLPDAVPELTSLLVDLGLNEFS
jgi:hypothetical protein